MSFTSLKLSRSIRTNENRSPAPSALASPLGEGGAVRQARQRVGAGHAELLRLGRLALAHVPHHPNDLGPVFADQGPQRAHLCPQRLAVAGHQAGLDARSAVLFGVLEAGAHSRPVVWVDQPHDRVYGPAASPGAGDRAWRASSAEALQLPGERVVLEPAHAARAEREPAPPLAPGQAGQGDTPLLDQGRGRRFGLQRSAHEQHLDDDHPGNEPVGIYRVDEDAGGQGHGGDACSDPQCQSGEEGPSLEVVLPTPG